MKKLTNCDLSAAMDYILREPEFNLFLIGDLENYGLESESVAAYTADEWYGGMLPYFILDYRNNFLVYSHNEEYDVKTVAEFLSKLPMRNLSGKRELVEPLLPLLGGLVLRPTYMARLEEVKFHPDLEVLPGKLDTSDIPAIYDLLIGIEEFYTMREKSMTDAYEDIRESMVHGGRMYGIRVGERLATVAATTAENSMSAMVVSVATHPDYRHHGYASTLVSRLCEDCMAQGMKFLCLFYDNPKAGAIYRKIGFQEIGEYAMVMSTE